MSAPYCPKSETLRRLAKEIPGQWTGDVDELDELVNALRFLDNMLTNRRMYQKKTQIRRKVMTKLMIEHGLDREIDNAVEAQFPNIAEAESMDDLEEKE